MTVRDPDYWDNVNDADIHAEVPWTESDVHEDPIGKYVFSDSGELAALRFEGESISVGRAIAIASGQAIKYVPFN